MWFLIFYYKKPRWLFLSLSGFWYVCFSYSLTLLINICIYRCTPFLNYKPKKKKKFFFCFFKTILQSYLRFHFTCKSRFKTLSQNSAFYLVAFLSVDILQVNTCISRFYLFRHLQTSRNMVKRSPGCPFTHKSRFRTPFQNSGFYLLLFVLLDFYKPFCSL